MSIQGSGQSRESPGGLSSESLEWAIQFVADHSDGDLFPRVAETLAAAECKSELATAIVGKPLSSHIPAPARRFIVPKDEISYRQATQLHPQDSIILSAIVVQYGHLIESKRLSRSTVFSYRFAPTSEYGLYDNKTGWNDFWTTARERALDAEFVVYCDISDFYNQVAHHSVENQLISCGLPNQAIKWIISLLESTTAGVSRGVPIGPHSAHIIAEASLISVDNSLTSSGISFVRYADDIIVFCVSEKDAKRSLARIATILDKQQRLTLQRHKTRLYRSEEFDNHCVNMSDDRPINASEESFLDIIKKYSGGSPYVEIGAEEIDPEDWAKIKRQDIEDIVDAYLNETNVDYVRLSWFYRRLAQVGHPDAIEITLDRMEFLTPCFGSVCSYLSSVQLSDKSEWVRIGVRLLGLLEFDEVKDSEYFRLSILSLFSKNAHINHFSYLSNMYDASDASAKREILLAAKTSTAIDWLREFKEGFGAMDQWSQMAYLYCLHEFPADERKYFINRHTFDRPFETVLARWARKGR